MQRSQQHQAPLASSRPDNGNHSGRRLPLTVDEALQYSPLSSIVPFGPGPIPQPRVLNTDSSSLLSDQEQHAARYMLEQLDHETSRGSLGPSNVPQSVHEVQQLLDPRALSNLTFKGLSGRTGSALGARLDGNASLMATGLGRFTETLFNMTDISFRYPTPQTPSRRADERQPNGVTKGVSSSSTTKQRPQNVESPTTPTPQYGLPTPERRITSPVVIVPKLSPSQRQEYVDYTLSLSEDEKDRRHAERKPRTQQPRASSHAGLSDSRQQQKTEAALRRFLHLVAKVYAAEDQLQPDTSGAVSTSARDYFIFVDTDDDTAHVLAPGVQAELESLLQQLITGGRFGEVPFDTIIRLQKLCETGLHLAEGLEGGVRELSSEEEVERWLRTVPVIDAGLRTTRSLLMIINGGREEKQIYSEEILQSILNLLKSTLDGIIIRIIEMRSTGSGELPFRALTSHKQSLTTLFGHVTKILQLLATLIAGEGLTESAVTTIEFLTIGLIFVENAFSEKDSVLGVHRCDRLRVVAMDVLVQAFSTYNEHQAFIFDEVLTSLEKLPVTRQKARQYKLPDGKAIQLVSALIMRLIQSSSVSRKRRKVARKVNEDRAAIDSHMEVGHQPRGAHMADTTSEVSDELPDVMQKLSSITQPLLDIAQMNAQYVVHFLVSRALKSTKTGGDPYRTLLDIFTEDFLVAMDSPSWPSAETLLRCLLSNMVGLVGGEKSNAPAKNMALDLLGLMGAALSDTLSQLRRAAKSLENGETELDQQLLGLVDLSLGGELEERSIVGVDGPYPLILAHRGDDDSTDEVVRTARTFHVLQWAAKISSSLETVQEGQEDTQQELEAAQLVHSLVVGEKQASDLDVLGPTTPAQVRVAYMLILLNMPFGKAFERILILLLNSMNSEQATVRSKGLKSVIQIIEKDPTVLDRGTHVMRHIINRASDPSPLVRDSALGLITKCTQLRPALDDQILDCILARAADTQVGVRKRALKILRDIYLRKHRKEVRAAIADALLHRMTDSDEGVSELAKQLLEESWISPLAYSGSDNQGAVSHGLAIKEQAALIVETIRRGNNVSTVFGAFLHSAVGEQSKNASSNVRVCKELVSSMFDDVLDNGDSSDSSRKQAILQTLTVFAKARAELFRADQLEHLQVYVEHLSHNDDLQVFRSVVIIFRWVLPHLPHVKTKFLGAVQKALLESLTKLGKRELNEVVACLWTINDVLNTIDRLSKVTISCIRAVWAARTADFSKPEQQRQTTTIVRYMNIAGLFGKHCDFSSDLPRFQEGFPWWKGDFVPALLVDVFAPFTAPKQPSVIRTAALDGLGSVCQAWPRMYLKDQVVTALDIVFTEGNSELESLVLNSMKEYLATEEKRSEGALETSKKPKQDSGTGRLAGNVMANQNDGVATSLAQRYLKHIVRVALATQEGYALNATEVVASINRQGLVHPRESVAVLVALETSSNATISKIAFREHRFLHQKHETIVEKEYMKAVQQAFQYQRTVSGDVRGATTKPFTSKLHLLWEVIKTSKGKIRKKFLVNICAKMDVDLAKLDISDNPPLPFLFAMFVAENLAFFEYSTVDEVTSVIHTLERLVSTSGALVAHALEMEVFQKPSAAEDPTSIHPVGVPAPTQAVDQSRMTQLATASAILSSAWDVRSFLCRLYGLNTSAKPETKGKTAAKDINKAPTKQPGITGQGLWDTNTQKLASMADQDSMLAHCERFLNLMTVDEDFKIAAEKEDSPGLGKRQGSVDDDSSAPPTPKSHSRPARKRKSGRSSTSQTPKKQRRASTPKFTATASEMDDYE
ncbi:MAG: U4/U6-U5 snRNP complex subunit dib1 [Watsoniomyces obsoletus]|nr:MAG: U4/U6-U5 snRNP complex subunit dib1 [Watsoniomyces obsoletus]